MTAPAQAASASAAAAAPMTPQFIQALVKDTMMTQQSQLLNLAETNALRLLREENRRNHHTLIDTINAELGATKEYDHHDWQNPTNKLTFKAMHQIEQMWKKTKRLVEAAEYQPEQKILKEAALKTINEGKEAAYKQIKLIKFADREGGRQPKTTKGMI